MLPFMGPQCLSQVRGIYWETPSPRAACVSLTTILSICCLREPPCSLCGLTYYGSHDRHRSLGVSHSFIQQTYTCIPCAGHLREALRIQTPLTSSEADVHGTTHTHGEFSLWYVLDIRKYLQRVSKTGA